MQRQVGVLSVSLPEVEVDSEDRAYSVLRADSTWLAPPSKYRRHGWSVRRRKHHGLGRRGELPEVRSLIFEILIENKRSWFLLYTSCSWSLAHPSDRLERTHREQQRRATKAFSSLNEFRRLPENRRTKINTEETNT